MHLRIACKSLLAARTRHPPLLRRKISATPRRTASEDPNAEALANFRNSPLMHQISNKPDALNALKDFALMIQDLGIQFSPARPPSTWQMLKLAANPKFREGVQRVTEELRKAGVEITPENAVELLTGKRGPQ
ncbi:hypothetical protein BD410DRAFT_892758 [Rickenella mellea]|uniref:Uncharacterized protein n=1 Tax=Rickenella mellea TaxID=50990 RepID=A0A4R5XEE8_9AGAM|nr:hypothetical protein BD410DRAFT_892758 [Rickenella mellea]